MSVVRTADGVKVAQRFIAGVGSGPNEISPRRGRLKAESESRGNQTSVVRSTDLFVNFDLVPALKCWASFISSAARTILPL